MEVASNGVFSQLILIFILTLINAFFSAAEMAIVSTNKNKLRILVESGDKRAINLEQLVSNPANFLSTIQVGITLAGFFSSAFAASGLSKHLAGILYKYNIPYSDEISLVAITMIISYITLVLGELFPKRLALKNPESIALFSTTIIVYFSRITKPFVKLLSISTNLLLRIFKLDIEALEEKVSIEEIRSLIEVGQENGVINETEKEMIESIFDFDNTLAVEVMTPRTEVFMIDIEDPIEDLLQEISAKNFSRIPVFKDTYDNIIGILLMKDLYSKTLEEGFHNINLEAILRNPYFVPETINIDILFRDLQKTKNHMAILIDEYGGFSGVVTLDDLIEEIMGDIYDEHEVEEETGMEKIDDFTYLVNGRCSLYDLNEELNINIEDDDVETLSGLLIKIMGKIPSSKDTHAVIYYDGLGFKIEAINKHTISKVKVFLEQKANKK
ncbi:hemolysin family protein [Clostridium cellulovorans]|uniref:CBS domain containing protein n=1 Tax=Clostridium cellulovorans (strain ATCC 35296 / DSM 3052 / OCM 3 / 743B) TaxID=573061 RepID=D9SVR3_CLOC7|nr:hemolysin family protein [Clostridium cellulovorans]ADL53124.1 protein of unknown function DUF21 [Clostridium cellulovorans 743B]